MSEDAGSVKSSSTSTTTTKKKTPTATIVLIIISIITVIFFIIALSLILTASSKVKEDKKASVNAAGALVGLSIPFAVIAIIVGILWVGKKSKGQPSRGLGIAFVIFAILASILLLIGVIIAFTTANDSPAAKSQLQAGAVFAIIAFIMFIVIFIIVVAAKRAAKTTEGRKEQEKNFLGEKNATKYRSYKDSMKTNK